MGLQILFYGVDRISGRKRGAAWWGRVGGEVGDFLISRK